MPQKAVVDKYRAQHQRQRSERKIAERLGLGLPGPGADKQSPEHDVESEQLNGLSLWPEDGAAQRTPLSLDEQLGGKEQLAPEETVVSRLTTTGDEGMVLWSFGLARPGWPGRHLRQRGGPKASFPRPELVLPRTELAMRLYARDPEDPKSSLLNQFFSTFLQVKFWRSPNRRGQFIKTTF